MAKLNLSIEEISEEGLEELRGTLTTLRNGGRVRLGEFSDNASNTTEADEIAMIFDEILDQISGF